MDIQVASNFERALFEASDRNATWVSDAMREFAVTRSLTIPLAVLSKLRQFYEGARANEQETLAAMSRTYSETGRVVDPHTAVGIAANRGQLHDGWTVFLATAHPAKFPEAIARAGLPPPALPPKLANLMQGKERCTMLPNDGAAVRRFILERTEGS